MEVSSAQMILGLIVAIVLLIFLVLKTRVHVFLALTISAIIAGLIGGMEPTDVVTAVSQGFGSTLGSIGIIIGFGIMIGKVMEISGAAERLAYQVVKFVGKKKEEWAIALAGYIISIPIFVDSAFVILHPLVKALSRQTGKSVITLGVALGIGLAATHHAVPPTPGPLGVAGIFGADIGLMVLLGLVISIPVVISGVLYAQWLGKKIYQLPEADGEGYYRPTTEEVFEDFKNQASEREKELPGFTLSLMPILIPLLLIFLNTGINALVEIDVIHINETVHSYITFLGSPIIAVAIGLLFALFTLAKRFTVEETLEELEVGLNNAGIILLVTGAGGAFGAVLRESGAGTVIAEEVVTWSVPAVLIPFLIATFVRLIQGSGTVAMITAASISAPILGNLDINPVLAAQAAAFGAMIFSYFNDSLFWVVNRMMGIKKVKEQVLVWSVPTTIGWAVSGITLVILSLFI
ncbi:MULTISPECIES: GntP family permease [Nosocomiicoccus]|uniref:Gluconate:H+ symporter n=1 Tax=Nosocomiicoccus massiliensis TaxID=1232430 RepID=A0AAF1BMQ7_9STAP|nr:MULTISPECIES: gluconate:H+ symporter [Nosocomiicoccus]OFO50870.1 gluconate permease [Nosocomiicoccus sp. HMSC059G07]WOS96274.1 gluconate:H+ symporter [Nosocomiicoccus massiliensis]